MCLSFIIKIQIDIKRDPMEKWNGIHNFTRSQTDNIYLLDESYQIYATNKQI